MGGRGASGSFASLKDDSRNRQQQEDLRLLRYGLTNIRTSNANGNSKNNDTSRFLRDDKQRNKQRQRRLQLQRYNGGNGDVPAGGLAGGGGGVVVFGGDDLQAWGGEDLLVDENECAGGSA
jgi:hypothetical protein